LENLSENELIEAYHTANSLLKDECEDSLFQFLKTFWDVATGEPYRHNWHIEYLCSTLQEHILRLIAREKVEYDWIIINVPPGTSKSTIGSVMAPAWIWAHDPSLRLITGSFDAKLATRLAVCSRDIIQSERYQEYWGDKVALKLDANNKTVYDTTKSGTRMTCSTRGSITGNHGHLVIIDDPIDPQGEKSEAEKVAVIDWISKTLPSRILNDEIALKILIMQRLGENDPTGYLLDKEGLNILHICLPAETTDLDNVSPRKLKDNYKDGLLDPIRKGKAVLQKRKTDLGSAEYGTQYLQNPASASGNIWQRKWWRFYQELPNEKIITKVQSWDTAFDEKRGNDFWCGTTWYQYASGYYLVDFFMQKMRSPEGIRQIQLWDAKHHPHHVLIEKKASGIVALQILEDETSLPLVKDIIPHTDKVARASSATPTVEAGNVFLPENAPWTSDLIDRLAMFPNGTHDDDSDSISQYLNWIRERPSTFKVGHTRKIKPKLQGW
jgi:predicted phage terminase large subunit-like protein